MSDNNADEKNRSGFVSPEYGSQPANDACYSLVERGGCSWAEEFYIGCGVREEDMPPLYMWTREQVVIVAWYAVGKYTDNPITPGFRISKKTAGRKLVEVDQDGSEGVKIFYADNLFLGVCIESSSAKAVVARSKSYKLWKRRINKLVNHSRLDYEAKNKVLGGKTSSQKYASNKTVEWMRQQDEKNREALKGRLIQNKSTGEIFSLLDVALKGASNRFSELYAITKNFQMLADEREMVWLFVTFTAPPEFHPNPVKGRCKYRGVGVKASHDYINNRFKRLRAQLAKSGIKAGLEGYFGTRVVEPHKDGCVHWHLIVFIKKDLVPEFERACTYQFPMKNQLKIVYGDNEKGSASSYIFKYLFKGVVVGDLGSEYTSVLGAVDAELDADRESNDLASIGSSERVRAAIRALGIRQYQNFGVSRKIAVLRAINRMDAGSFDSMEGSMGVVVREKVYRNPSALKNLLGDDELMGISFAKEGCFNSYGEKREKVVGIRFGGGVCLKIESKYKLLDGVSEAQGVAGNDE